MDVLTVPIKAGSGRAEISETFLAVVEPGSVLVLSAVFDKPFAVGVQISGRHLVANINTILSGQCTLLIGGIRKGCSGLRFPPRTDEQMARNERNWRELNG